MGASMTPEISVLLGTYYQRQDTTMLEQSVNSILSQSFSDFELLICDDGSSEEACALLEHFARLDKRVRLIRNGNLFTLPQKLNACLRASRGAWIARMDDDDISAPTRFACQLVYLQRHPEIAFVGCNAALRCGGQPAGKRVLPAFPTVQDFYMTQPFLHPTLLFRRQVLLAAGGYSEDRWCVLCEDYDLLLRLYAVGCRGANLQQELFTYSIPADGRGNRRMCHRINEMVTRYRRFRELGCLPLALPFVVKPVIVGLIPTVCLRKYSYGRK